MKVEERGGDGGGGGGGGDGGGGREEGDQQSSRSVYACLVANCFNRKPQFQSVSRSDPKSDRTEPKCDAMRCARTNVRTIERSIDRQRLNIDFDHI